MTLLGFARVMHVAMPTEHINDEMSTISKKSREGLYFTQDTQASLAQTGNHWGISASLRRDLRYRAYHTNSSKF